MSANSTQALELVGTIYDAAVQPECWSAVVTGLADALAADSGLLKIVQAPDHHDARFIASNLDPDALDEYAERHIGIDVVNWYAARMPPGFVTASHLFLTDRERERLEFYNVFLRRLDIFYTASANLQRSESQYVQFAVHRSRRKGPFSDEALSLLRTLAPHMQRALAVNERLGLSDSHCEAAGTILERLSVGVVLLAESGEVVYANRRAERLLADGDGIGVVQRRVVLSMKQEHAALESLIGGALRTVRGEGLDGGGCLRVSRPGRAQPLHVSVMPMRTANALLDLGHERVCAALFLSDPVEAPAPPAAVLMALFGLTRAEARVAGALADGRSLEEVSERFRLSKQTVRTQLKSVFIKTGTSRQSELVRLVLTSPAYLGEAQGLFGTRAEQPVGARTVAGRLAGD